MTQETLDIPVPDGEPTAEPQFHGHGWERDGTVLAIGLVPTRTLPCLYSQQGAVVQVYGTFRDWSAAYDAMAVIDHIVGVAKDDE